MHPFCLPLYGLVVRLLLLAAFSSTSLYPLALVSIAANRQSINFDDVKMVLHYYAFNIFNAQLHSIGAVHGFCTCYCTRTHTHYIHTLEIHERDSFWDGFLCCWCVLSFVDCPKFMHSKSVYASTHLFKSNQSLLNTGQTMRLLGLNCFRTGSQQFHKDLYSFLFLFLFLIVAYMHLEYLLYLGRWGR